MTAQESTDNIWIAAGDGHLDRVKELLDSGINVDIQDNKGYTALHAAVSYNHKNIVELLFKHGANVNIEDVDGDTPLFVAETVNMAKFLVEECSADAKHRNKDDTTAAVTALNDEDRPREVAEFLANFTHETLPTCENNEDLSMEYLQAEEGVNEEHKTLINYILQQAKEEGDLQKEEEQND